MQASQRGQDPAARGAATDAADAARGRRGDRRAGGARPKAVDLLDWHQQIRRGPEPPIAASAAAGAKRPVRRASREHPGSSPVAPSSTGIWVSIRDAAHLP